MSDFYGTFSISLMVKMVTACWVILSEKQFCPKKKILAGYLGKKCQNFKSCSKHDFFENWVILCKKKNSEKFFLAIFSIFGAPKKPKKSKFQENEKNVQRYFPRDAKKTKTHHPQPSGKPKVPWKQQKVPKMQFSGGKIGPKNGATEKMIKSPRDMPIMMQNTKNQPYMTIQCLWKPVQKPEKMDYFGLKRGWI